MEISKFILACTLPFLLAGCSEKHDFEGITNMERRLRELSVVEADSAKVKAQAGKLIAAYQEYAAANPQSQESGDYLYKAAGLVESYERNPELTFSLLEKAAASAATAEVVCAAIFKMAEMARTQLDDKELALSRYKQFLERCPTDFRIMRAKIEIDSLK